MSKDMAVKLVQGFSVAPYFKLEDVFIGIAFKEANVKLTDIERANNNYHYLYSFEVSNCKRSQKQQRPG